MKTYEILKPWDGLNKGLTIDIDFKVTAVNGISINFLLDQGYIKEIKKDIKSIYNLKKCEGYWYINIEGYPIPVTWNNNNTDIDRLTMGNVFLTEKHALLKIHKDKHEALIKLQSWKYENDIT